MHTLTARLDRNDFLVSCAHHPVAFWQIQCHRRQFMTFVCQAASVIISTGGHITAPVAAAVTRTGSIENEAPDTSTVARGILSFSPQCSPSPSVASQNSNVPSQLINTAYFHKSRTPNKLSMNEYFDYEFLLRKKFSNAIEN